ncbi:MlaE family lipid ABC transporter permease subunit [Sphingorhabdus sp. Alg239-R122]|uniref:ABC transporter permease n=1 Tax=Sphingorhabdus sp. Alg239-R122 TaxID=2305989 RepID=UPI0013DAC84D|nr:MlaE family lipid ABC transporter permease subunit [Sphingorhabdus sp. Alg239-R122]
MGRAADFTIDTLDDGTQRVLFSGDLDIADIGGLSQQLDAIEGPVTEVDISGVEKMDTVGAWLCYRLARDHGATIAGEDNDQGRLIEAVGNADNGGTIREKRPIPPIYAMKKTGEAVLLALTTFVGMISFFGGLVRSFFAVLLHPGRFRFKALVRQFELVGVSALGIIGLMSFLIGIVIAQQGAVQLRQFGAEVYTINLVGRLTLRELGVLMTAIMVAGRSGSAFAAQLGTMKLTEEVDAMRTIGVSPMEALVLPRFLASVLMMPLLGFYACIMAMIGGGLLSWISLDIPPATFVQRIREVVPLYDVWVGLIKAPVFGAIIALSGCFQGMQVKGNAEEVGLRTTAAVVQAIFMVIVLDAFFAVFFTWVGWA